MEQENEEEIIGRFEGLREEFGKYDAERFTQFSSSGFVGDDPLEDIGGVFCYCCEDRKKMREIRLSFRVDIRNDYDSNFIHKERLPAICRTCYRVVISKKTESLFELTKLIMKGVTANKIDQI